MPGNDPYQANSPTDITSENTESHFPPTKKKKKKFPKSLRGTNHEQAEIGEGSTLGKK